jgi:hypothetical protein
MVHAWLLCINIYFKMSTHKNKHLVQSVRSFCWQLLLLLSLSLRCDKSMGADVVQKISPNWWDSCYTFVSSLLFCLLWSFPYSCKSNYYLTIRLIRLEVLTAVKMLMMVFQFVMPCGHVSRYQHLGRTYWLQFQNLSAVYSSEILVSTYTSTWHYNL